MKKITFAALLLSLFAATVRADDWPHWRGPKRTGISEEKGWKSKWPSGGPKILWRAQVGIGYSAFSVADGRAYVTGNNGGEDTVFCFDAESGKEIWKHTFTEPLASDAYTGGTSATPTIAGGMVYSISKSGKAFCFRADTGKIVWQKDLRAEGYAKPRWGFAGSPVVIGTTVVLNVGTYGLALEAASGKEVWSTGKGASGYATAVPYKAGKALVVFSAKGLAGVDAASGKVLWKHGWKTSYDVNAADPIIVGKDRVFVASGYRTGCALLKIGRGGVSEVWANKSLRCKTNGGVMFKGYVYATDQTGRLKCVDLKSGKIAWAERGFGMGGVMIADGKLIVLSEKGELSVAPASPKGYQPTARAQVLSGGRCWTVPVLANGRIYGRNSSGAAVCVDVK